MVYGVRIGRVYYCALIPAYFKLFFSHTKQGDWYSLLLMGKRHMIAPNGTGVWCSILLEKRVENTPKIDGAKYTTQRVTHMTFLPVWSNVN